MSVAGNTSAGAGQATQPAAGAAVVTITVPAPGDYDVEVTAYQDGTIDTASAADMDLRHGSIIVGKILSGRYPQTQRFLRVTIPPTDNPVIAAPSVAAGAAGTPNGTYKVTVTFVTATGETAAGTEATVSVTNAHIAWSNIPLGPAGTIGRNLYRTQPAGATGTEKRLTAGTTIADNSTTTFDDNIADATIAANVAQPTQNSSGLFTITVNATAQPAASAIFAASVRATPVSQLL